jgi:rubrerythrin
LDKRGRFETGSVDWHLPRVPLSIRFSVFDGIHYSKEESMTDTKAEDILKSAILLEMRGRAFYEKAAQNAESQAVKDLFQTMANEEKGHIKMLSAQYSALKAKGKFISAVGEFKPEYQKISEMILSNDVIAEISASAFESAAVAAAMGMEEKAIALYAERAETATDPMEKKLYQWLADWETGHLNFLAKIDKEITETIWFDNSYWPF